MISIIGAMTASAIRATGVIITIAVTLCIIAVTIILYRKALKEEAATATDSPEQAGAEDPDVTAEDVPAEDPATEDEPAAEDEQAVEEAKEPEQEDGPVEEAPAVTTEEEQPDEETPTVTEEETAAVKDEAEQTEKYPSFIEKYITTLGENGEAFERIVLKNEEELKTRIKYPVTEYEDEKAFVTDYFRSSGKYAKLMPIAVTEMLYKRNAKYIETDKERSRAMRKMIAAYYSRRKEEETLGKCEKLCKQDAEYWIQTGEVQGKALPPLKKLVTMCTAQNRYAEAISWCDKAIENGIIDAKGMGYEGRKAKVEEKKEKYETKIAKQKAKEEKQRQSNSLKEGK